MPGWIPEGRQPIKAGTKASTRYVHRANPVKLADIVYRALHGTAPRYLAELLRRVADMPSRSPGLRPPVG